MNMIDNMYESLELLLFSLTTFLYVIAWGWHLRGWQLGSSSQTRVAINILWFGWLLHLVLICLRWYQAGHIPLITAFEFVTFFAMLVIGVFLLFSLREENRMLGVFLLPVGLFLMFYAALLSRDVQPELVIFNSLLLKFHVLTTLLGYAAWATTFAASISYLYLEKKKTASPRLFDQMAYRASFFAFCFLTLGIITGALWGIPGLPARALHAGLERPPRGDIGHHRFPGSDIYLCRGGYSFAADTRCAKVKNRKPHSCSY
jgi:ABC-type transport system involved in cytochrome c biogenesis permease subunit